MKNGKVRFRLNIDVRKEMEDSRLNAIKQLITFVKGRLNFSCKSATAANVDLTESRLDTTMREAKEATKIEDKSEDDGSAVTVSFHQNRGNLSYC